MEQPISLRPSEIEQTAQSVAATLAQAARPGPVPAAAGGSPVDAAASAVAGAVVRNVAAASAELGPKSAEGLALSRAALAQAHVHDTDNAARIKTVPDDMGASPAEG